MTEETPPKKSNRTLYYSRYSQSGSGYSAPQSYGRPMYNAPSYGTPSYGMNTYGQAGSSANDDDSALGALNIGRIIRVCLTHWMTILVFLILGILAAFVIFKLMPIKYRATSVFEMSITPRSMIEGQIFEEVGGVQTMKEVFNTRLQQLRSEPVFKSIIERYRTEHASSTVSQEEIIEILRESEIELVPLSRLINLTTTSTSPELSADLANAYALACESFMLELNKTRAEGAVAWLTSMVDNQERSLARREQELMDMRKMRKLDAKNREREEKQIRLSALNSQLIILDTDIARTKELVTSLKVIAQDPSKFGMVSESIPRSSEISQAYSAYQGADALYKTTLMRMTKSHPEVINRAKDIEIYKAQFEESVIRANETTIAELDVLQRQQAPIAIEVKQLSAELVALDIDVITTEMSLQQLERNCAIEREKVTQLRIRMSRAELKADENAAIIQQVRSAEIPQTPSSPQPLIIFPAGMVIGLALGAFFVLLLDHMEDKLVGVSDIEQRLRLKALAIMPHLRRKQRAQIAMTTHEDPFSQYSESMAGLRNLLDSPRYHDMTKVVLVMSTQPAEGKTCTATNLATSYAQSGQKTLLVDFDLRRPRLAGIFGMKEGSFESLPHILARNDHELLNSLPVKSHIPSLDLVFSRSSMSISPSILMGSNMIAMFFDWARQYYDRIVVDSPPLGLVGDSIVLANLVDSVLLVASPDVTRFGPIQFATRRLAEVGARVLGIIVNNVDYGRWAGFGKYESHYGYNRYSSYVPVNSDKIPNTDSTFTPPANETLDSANNTKIDAAFIVDEDE